MDDFSKQKIVWSDISTSSQFALVDGGVFINNTAYMIVNIEPSVIHVLNSQIMSWYFSKITSGLGKGSRYFKQFVEILPVPNFQDYKDLYLSLNERNADNTLSSLYDFSEEEKNHLGL